MSENSSSGGGDNAVFKVTVDGTEYTQENPQGLSYLRVEDHVDMIGVAEIGFSQNDGEDAGPPSLGAEVEVSVGGSEYLVFKGYVSAIRQSYQKGRIVFYVQAMDPLVKLAASRITKVYEEMTDSDIVSAVISRAGLTAGTVDSTSLSHPYVLQRNESDLSFLRRLAARNGYLLMATEGKIDFKKPQFGDATEVKKSGEEGGGGDTSDSMVISFDFTYSTVNVPKEVKVVSWDYRKKEEVEFVATELEAIGGGKAANSETAGMMWEGRAAFVSDVWGDEVDMVKGMAESDMNRFGRQFLKGRAVFQGSGDYHAGTMYKFSGYATGFNPTVFVIGSRHVVQVGIGFTSEIMFCSNTYPE